jgi:ribokinase
MSAGTRAPARPTPSVRLTSVRSSGSRLAVVGHVEWVQFARVAHVPVAGEVVHALQSFEEPAGGGAVAAVALARLAGTAQLFTVLGDDELGRRSRERLSALGVEVHASIVAEPTRRAVTLVDEHGERTITTFGPRLEPLGEQDPERWGALRATDATYFTAGDLAALRHARERSRVLVANPRARAALGHGVALEAIVLSGQDEIELAALDPARREAQLLCFTEGARGGRYVSSSAGEGRWRAAAPPAPLQDSYGAGDSFAAGLTYALGAGIELDKALALAARCGAYCIAGRGPYESQLTARELAGAG